MQPIRLGIMGFGRVGRQLYQLAIQDKRFEVVAISDIGSAGILHNLLNKMDHDLDVKLEKNMKRGHHALLHFCIISLFFSRKMRKNTEK